MFENRIRGAQLAKNVSYLYIIIAVLVIIGTILIGINIYALNIIFYLIMFAAVYLMATKYKDNKYAWIFIAISGIITLIWSLSILGFAIAVLSIVAANDMRKELESDS